MEIKCVIKRLFDKKVKKIFDSTKLFVEKGIYSKKHIQY